MKNTHSFIFEGRTFDFERDYARLSVLQARVLAILLDGKWHYAPDLIEMTGGSSADVRARDLRKEPFCMNVESETFPPHIRCSYRLDLNSADPHIVTAVLEGRLHRIPDRADIPDDPDELRNELHEMVDAFSDVVRLQHAWKAVHNHLEKDTGARTVKVVPRPGGMQAKQWSEVLHQLTEDIEDTGFFEETDRDYSDLRALYLYLTSLYE